MYTGDPPRLCVSRSVQAVIAAAGAVLVLALSLPAAASANDYACQGSEAKSGHCYAVVMIHPGGIPLNGTAVHIFTNNDYVPALCNGGKTLCDFVTNEQWALFNSSASYWTEAGDFTGGDFGYETESPTDFAGNNPVNNSGFGFFVWPSGGPGQDSTNEVQIRYNGGGNYSINFNGTNVFNFGNDAATEWFEGGMEETDTGISSEGALYDMYLYGESGKEYYWTPGTEYTTPNNSSIICGWKYAEGNKLIQQDFKTTSTLGGTECK